MRFLGVRTTRFGGLLAAVCLLLPRPALPAAPVRLSGSILGVVNDSQGVPQFGAVILLYNRFDRLVQRVLTDERGRFSFDTLNSDRYSVRVNLPSFMPVLKENITVQPGMQSLLAIQVSSVLSTIQLIKSVPTSGTLMTDEWRWGLRGNLSTRSVLRYLPDQDPTPANPRTHNTSPFTATRGLVRVSAGDSAGLTGTDLTDVGTTFALSTSLYGDNQIQFSGNFGYSYSTGVPTAGFRTSYRRGESGPELNVTMRQIMLPSRFAGGLPGALRGDVPMMRSMSIGTADKLILSDEMKLEYGGKLDTVVAGDRVSYFSPFARLTYDAGDDLLVRFAYSAGSTPVELLSPISASEAGLQQDVIALSAFPRVTLRNSRMAVQRSSNYELGVSKKFGSRTIGASLYREQVVNAALTLSGDASSALSGDLLADFSSRNAIFNIGSYENQGLMAAVTQDLHEAVSITVAAGSGGGLRTESRAVMNSTPADDLRNDIRQTRRLWVMSRLSGTIPGAHTHYVASYQWTDYRTLTPNHLFLTQSLRPEAGLNVFVRQPMPGVFGTGRLELTAELRNLLAQGYLPIAQIDGSRMLLIQSPRAIRGGLSFIF